MNARRIAIVGQGVMGLTCAERLSGAGHRVDIFSREEFAQTTSMAAGAYWWPHKVFPEARVSAWARETYREYMRAAASPETGVHFETHFRFCLDPEDSAYARHLTEGWAEIDGAAHGIACHEAFRMRLPVIDVPVFLPHVRTQLQSRGVSFHVREIETPSVLFPEFDLVVNCTGVFARHFVDDEAVFPIRGQAVRVSLPGGLRASTRLYQKDDQFTLVLPRRSDVILGGTATVGDWDRTPNAEDTKRIVERCSELVPEIAASRVLGAAVGLRPGRSEVRLELEWIAPGRPVIHNYGHGGGGFTVAWGCANEVARLATERVFS